MNKSMISKKQVSFFGIFNGKNGVVKAEYYRDNFHLLLYRDEYFFRDMERAIQRTLIIIERNFEEDKREKEAKSEVTFILSVLMENIVFVIKLGELKPVFSMNFG